ncbi:MAG TPA: PEP/pyruvate-binding domain-containing protein [Bacteroidota bacterium]
MAIELFHPTPDEEPQWDEQVYGTKFQGFQYLMRFRVRDLLLVSSLYDRYLFEEDGKLYEQIQNEYEGLRVSNSPDITRVSNAEEAIRLLHDSPFDLIITTPHIEDMDALTFAQTVRKAGINTPIVLLAYDNRDLRDMMTHYDLSIFERIFIWQGDFRLLIGIMKDVEDRHNVDHDTRIAGVQSIILIEDDIRYYSTFLPIAYTEVLKQTQRLISEGINISHKVLRMRARPKILLCRTYEEACGYFDKYEDTILGVISDVDFPRNGRQDPKAGIAFARHVKERHQDIPILLQSYVAENEQEAHETGAGFILKDSPSLRDDLRSFMTHYLSFGDFIFRTPDGDEVGRASDLQSLEQRLHEVPDESISYHAERNHFSNWLKARTEFWLAHMLRPKKVTDYPNVEGLRAHLINSLHNYIRMRQQGIIMDFSRDSFDPSSSFARIGTGSVGGKARGLGFINMMIHNYSVRRKFDDVEINVPPGVVIATDVFDYFLNENHLREFAIITEDDDELTRRFLEAPRLPEDVVKLLGEFLDGMKEPLAVRSSSLLEDSQYHPFAGVYETYMIPNNHPNPFIRLTELLTTIKRVYASTFYKSPRDYIKHTSYRIDQEKMAVIIQRMIGAPHGTRFYPDFSGVGRSHNFYPLAPQRSEDGIASVALGLGKTIVEGGMTVRFCPRYPDHLPQFSSPSQYRDNNQKDFYALELTGNPLDPGEGFMNLLKQYELRTAEKDGTLMWLGSTYSSENDSIYEGTSRDGIRLVTFSSILRRNTFPLAGILDYLMHMGSWGMGSPVEMEFAVNLSVPDGISKEFGVLQMRPVAIGREVESIEVEVNDRESVLCHSRRVLGHGVMRDLQDIVFVDVHSFDRSKSRQVAKEITAMNQELTEQERPYLLIGVGRWGSLDPWLGIPVKWDQIAGAKAIIETGFKDIEVAPSQGSHFFQNITSFMVGYFTVDTSSEDAFLDWRWLFDQPAAQQTEFVRHIRLDSPLIIKMDGRQNRGIILKPSGSTLEEELKER